MFRVTAPVPRPDAEDAADEAAAALAPCSVRPGSVCVSTVVTASRTTATPASASTERRRPKRSGSASRSRFRRAVSTAARCRASWAARAESTAVRSPAAFPGPGRFPRPVRVRGPGRFTGPPGVVLLRGHGARRFPLLPLPVHRRRRLGQPRASTAGRRRRSATSTATSPILTSSSCPYRVPVNADQEPSCRQDW
ncbi:hypothetical protein GCM10019016_062060 [Streptomyces prasinosporus]|uniref:Uncharacterized protein n=1 Tax=Streptomyces prasinosporus TaxID=68256 RepID=A0ABP6TWH5_9ACTN